MRCRSVLSIAVVGVGALVVLMYHDYSVVAAEGASGIVPRKVVREYWQNDEGKDLVLCIAGEYGTVAFALKKGEMIPVDFWDDGHERVISAFLPGQKKVCAVSVHVPISACWLVKCGQEPVTKKEFTPRPELKATNIEL